MIDTFTPLSTYSETDRSHLIKNLKDKNKHAFKFLYDNYNAALHIAILQIVYDKQISEDVLQESFLKIWVNIGQYDASKSSLFTWMHAISRNCAIDTVRSKHYKNNNRENLYSLSAIKGGEIFFNIKDSGLRKIVSTLPQHLNEIISLFYFEGFTEQEISNYLELPKGTVKTRKRIAITTLRKMMKREIAKVA